MEGSVVPTRAPTKYVHVKEITQGQVKEQGVEQLRILSFFSTSNFWIRPWHGYEYDKSKKKTLRER